MAAALGQQGGAMAAIAAASELQQVPRLKYILFVLLAAFIQFNWGLFGVCTRYLQTSARRPIPSIQLAVTATVVATAGLVCFVALPAALRAALRAALSAWGERRRRRRQQQQQQRAAVVEACVAAAPSTSAAAPQPRAGASRKGREWAVIDLEAGARTEACGDPAAADAASGAKRAARHKRLVSAAVASAIGLIVALQHLTLVYASRLTFAFLVQLIFLLTPLCAAAASRLLLRQPTPRGLWLALAAALGGSAMAVAGNYLGDRGTAGANGAFGGMEAGLALAAASMLLLTAYLVALQATQHATSGAAVMWANQLVGAAALAPLALVVEGTDWGWVRELSAFDWGIVFFAGFFINALNTLWTQAASRVLGAATLSLFICMRLVSSVAGSAALLREAPASPLVWAGMAVCVVAMTAFMGVQAWDKRGKEDEAAKAAAGPVDPPA